MKHVSSFFLVLLFISTNTFSQADFRQEYQKAMSAYDSGDYSSFMTGLEKTNSLRPNHRIVLYNLAIAYVLNDMPEKALSTLEYRASFYNVPDFQEDEDFKPLRELKGYKNLVQAIEKRSNALSNSEFLFEFEDRGFHPEGIAMHQEFETIFLSDVRCGLLKTVSFEGKEKEDFMDLKEEGFWGALGMKIDPLDNNVLWIVTSVLPQFCEYSEEINGRSALLKVDINKKEITESYTVEGNHIFGDLTISEEGDVFISDSNEPMIYSLKRGTKKIEPFLTSDQFFNLQGLDFGKNGYLYVSDYITGIYKIKLSDLSVNPLMDSDNQILRGTDGMYYANGNLVLLQNGTNPIKVSIIKLDESGNATAKSLKILDSNTSFLNEPTLGAILNNKLYFVSNSPWSYYEDNVPMLDKWPSLQIRTLLVE